MQSIQRNTFRIGNSPRTIGLNGVRRIIYDALKSWENVSALKFVEVSRTADADIEVSFERGEHGDSYPFDGPDVVLAHAFFPSPGRGGDVHFDMDEVWTEKLHGDTHTRGAFRNSYQFAFPYSPSHYTNICKKAHAWSLLVHSSVALQKSVCYPSQSMNWATLSVCIIRKWKTVLCIRTISMSPKRATPVQDYTTTISSPCKSYTVLVHAFIYAQYSSA
jgi:hypothetical protein